MRSVQASRWVTHAEVQTMLEHYMATTPMPIEDSKRIHMERPDLVFPFGYHLRRTPVDAEGGGIGLKPKCWWTMVGLKDLDILQLGGAFPTPPWASTDAFLTVSAGLQDVFCR